MLRLLATSALLVSLSSSLIAYDTLERSPHPTLLDLLQPTQPLNPEALFDQGVLAHTRIPAEHLRVAFYDAQTGAQLNRHDIRQHIGDAPHEAMVELLFISEAMVPNGLPMEVSQLVALMDASFLASMRRPPAIDVEFYDDRCGPQGILGGGVSGYVPENPCKPAGSSRGRGRQ